MISLKGNHITITKGDTGAVVFNFNQKCKDFNLNGWTVRFIVKQKGQPDTTAIIDSSTTVSTDTASVSIAIPAQSEVGDFDFAIRITKDGAIQTVSEGIFSIVQGVFA